ncbi:hypothetical protein Tco_0706018 [Tanacetum coccineum]|uniref:Tf2-1-like SH3-like domain-containing protein n=1 Tax=Tanacetum coccineum TaxID=301880 RepID=A0ABQ4Y7Q4_9ASTR
MLAASGVNLWVVWGRSSMKRMKRALLMQSRAMKLSNIPVGFKDVYNRVDGFPHPFKVLAKISPMAYTLEFSEELKGIHSTFHVLNLKKCLAEGEVVVLLEEIQLDDKLHMIEEPVEIVDKEVITDVWIGWVRLPSVCEIIGSDGEYNEQDVARLREIVIPLHKPYNSLLYVAGLSLSWKFIFLTMHLFWLLFFAILTMAEFQRLLDLHGCKITVRTLLTAGAALETHLSAPTARIENVPTKTGEMETAEVACGKVLAEKEKRKEKLRLKQPPSGNFHPNETQLKPHDGFKWWQRHDWWWQ